MRNIKDLDFILYGGDYNPDQWLAYPEILEKDIELFKKAKINCVSMGIFSWSLLEPEEGVFNFEWFDRIVEKLHRNNIKIILSTPSGARPVWLSEKYPEVLRKDPNRVRQLHSFRHNHCYSSPVYREKVKIINQELAKRYGKHEAVILWHISNELRGHCSCDLCEENFRKWIKSKYITIENLNHSWWTAFWSKSFTSFDQIRIPGGISETAIQGQNLDYKRFITDQTIDYYKSEVIAIKEVGTDIQFTTNFMNLFDGLDYNKFSNEVDIVSNDSYPSWHHKDHHRIAIRTSMVHALNRSMKQQPFLLMESTPSTTNWQNISKLKKPGMLKLASIQAIAEGSDSILYFQLRQSRGSYEKFHSAVISHDNSEKNRVYNEVKELGLLLEKMRDIKGTTTKTEVGIVFDWPNRWAIKGSKGPRNEGMYYEELIKDFYQSFYKLGVQTDLIGTSQSFEKYELLIVPMLYMVNDDTSRKLHDFVERGGTIVTSYFTGYVNENDLCYIGGFPGPLKDLLGVTIPEIDSLYSHESNVVEFKENTLNLSGEFPSTEICEIIEPITATVLAEYKKDFYQKTPAITMNHYGVGDAIHLATRVNEDCIYNLVQSLVNKLEITKVLNVKLPNGIGVAKRSDEDTEYIFILNFNNYSVDFHLDDARYLNHITKEPIKKKVTINELDCIILQRDK